jgi:hypothetical protein
LFLFSLLLASAAQAGPTPVYKIRIHAIAVSDGPTNADGSSAPWRAGQRAATVTPADVTNTVAGLNQIFAAAGIQFLFHQTLDFEKLQDTNINELTDPGGVDYWSHGNAIAALHPNKLVIFFRWGNTDPFTPSGWAFAFPPAGGGYVPPSAPLPTTDVHFVAYMNNVNAGPGALAHEIGHYLGLFHTFPGWNDDGTNTVAKAEAAIEAADGIRGLDGDGLSDTPPDAGRQYYQNIVDPTNLCSGKSYSITAYITGPPFGYPAWRSVVVSPDNLNAMSYFYCAPAHFSAQQIALMRQTLNGPYRKALLSPDLVVYRPWEGNWYARPIPVWNADFTQQWGLIADQPVVGDFDGDGTPDLAVWRPIYADYSQPAGGRYFILPSTRGLANYTTIDVGLPGDIPVPGDYDGDGKADAATWRPSDGTWNVVMSSTGTLTTVQWGLNGDVPVVADFDGDGRVDWAVWRPSDGTWYIIPSSGAPWRFVQWGTYGDIPVAADFDGDGKADIAVYRPSVHTWYVIYSSTGGAASTSWGEATDIPVPMDFDGDGKADIAIWRPRDGNWWVLPSLTPGNYIVQQWGTNGDVPMRMRQ